MADSNESQNRWEHDGREFVYEAFYSAAIGGSIVALTFLGVDFVQTEPLFTPSLMGSVLFGGASAAEVAGVDMGAVAQYTVVHFASFGILGMIVAFAAREAELHSRHPLAVMVAVFVALELAFVVAAVTALPGVLERLSVGWVALANALAAAGIAVFITSAHWPQLLRGLRRSA
jgi:hypothetical protein